MLALNIFQCVVVNTSSSELERLKLELSLIMSLTTH